jgi:hypothetical protein
MQFTVFNTEPNTPYDRGTITLSFDKGDRIQHIHSAARTGTVSGFNTEPEFGQVVEVTWDGGEEETYQPEMLEHADAYDVKFRRAREYSMGDKVWIPLGLGQAVEGEVRGEFPEGVAIMPGGELTAIHVDPDRILESAER